MSNLKANDFWRPRQQYYASDRIKTLLLQDNKFYVCTETHTSGDTFDDTKFILVSGGGTGGGSLIPSGDWDIVNSTEVGTPTELPILLTDFKDSYQYAENAMISGTNHTYLFSGPFYLYGAFTTNTIVNDFSTTKWITMNMVGFNTLMLYDSTGLTTDNAMTDVIQPSFVGSTTPTTYVSAIFGHAFGQSTISVNYNNSVDGFVNILQLTNTSHPALTNATYVSIGIDLSLGKIYVITDTTTLMEFSTPTTVLDAPELTLFAGGVYGNTFGSGETIITFPDTINYPPLTQLRSTTIVLPPTNAVDGTMWKLTSDGVFNLKAVKSNDYAIFFNNFADIVVISDTSNEISGLQSSVEILTTSVSNSSISLSDKSKLRGIIDYISQDAPPSPVLGKTVLCLSGTSITVNGSSVTPYQMVVYNGTAWEHVSFLQGTIWSHEASGLILYYNNSIPQETHELYSVNAAISELLTSSYWHVLDKYISSTLTLTPIDTDNTFNIYLETHRDVSILAGNTTFYTVNLVVPTTVRNNIKSNQEATLRLYNQSNVEVTFKINTSHISAPFTSKFITVPAYSVLELSIYSRDDGGWASFKYGEYKTNQYYLLSQMSSSNSLYNINEVFLHVDILEVLGTEIVFYITPFNRSYVFKLNLIVSENLTLTVRIVDENTDNTLATETISLVPNDRFKTLLYTPDTITPIRVY